MNDDKRGLHTGVFKYPVFASPYARIRQISSSSAVVFSFLCSACVRYFYFAYGYQKATWYLIFFIFMSSLRDAVTYSPKRRTRARTHRYPHARVTRIYPRRKDLRPHPPTVPPPLSRRLLVVTAAPDFFFSGRKTPSPLVFCILRGRRR